MLNISEIRKKFYLAEHFVQKSGDSSVTSLRVNSVMGIFWQVL